MRRRRGWMALAALALVGGCARPAPPQAVVAVPAQGRVAASRTPVVACSTTHLGIATVSGCGDAGLRLGVAAE